MLQIRNITPLIVWLFLCLHCIQTCDAVYHLRPAFISERAVDQLRAFSKVINGLPSGPLTISTLHPVARSGLPEIISLLSLNNDNDCLERIRRKPLRRRLELLRIADYLDMSIAPPGRRSFLELISDMYVRTLTKSMKGVGSLLRYRRQREIEDEEYLFSVIANALPSSALSSPSSCESCVELLPYLTRESIDRIYPQALALARSVKNRKSSFFSALRLIVAMAEGRFKIHEFDLFDKAIFLLKVRAINISKGDDGNDDIRTLCNLIRCLDESWTKTGTLTFTVTSWLNFIFLQMSAVVAAGADKRLLQTYTGFVNLIISRIHKSHFATVSFRGFSLLDSVIESMFVSYGTPYNFQTTFGVDLLNRIIDRTPNDILFKTSNGQTSLRFLLKTLKYNTACVVDASLKFTLRSKSDGDYFKWNGSKWHRLLVKLLIRRRSRRRSALESHETRT